MKIICFIVALLCLCVTTVAQDQTPVVTQPVEIDVVNPYNNLRSIPSIVAITLVLVELIKRMVRNASFLKDVPIWVYACAVSVAIATIAKWQGYLDGDWGVVLWQAGYGAAIASGVYTWFRKFTATPSNSA
jgi:hypothetical protein